MGIPTSSPETQATQKELDLPQKIQDVAHDAELLFPSTALITREVAHVLQNPLPCAAVVAKRVVSNVEKTAKELAACTVEDRVALKMANVAHDSRVTAELQAQGIAAEEAVPDSVEMFRTALLAGLRLIKRCTNSDATALLVEEELDNYIDSNESWLDKRTSTKNDPNDQTKKSWQEECASLENNSPVGQKDTPKKPQTKFSWLPFGHNLSKKIPKFSWLPSLPAWHSQSCIATTAYICSKFSALANLPVFGYTLTPLLPSLYARATELAVTLSTATFIASVPSVIAATITALVWGGPFASLAALLGVASFSIAFFTHYQTKGQIFNLDALRMVVTLGGLVQTHTMQYIKKALYPLISGVGWLVHMGTLYNGTKKVGQRYAYLDFLLTSSTAVSKQAQKESQKVINVYQKQMEAWQPTSRLGNTAKWVFENFYGRAFVCFTKTFASLKARIHLLPYACIARAQQYKNLTISPAASNIIVLVNSLRALLLDGMGLALGVITGAFTKPLSALSFLTDEPTFRGLLIQFIDTTGKNLQQLHKKLHGDQGDLELAFLEKLPPSDAPDRDSQLSEISTASLFKIFIESIQYVAPKKTSSDTNNNITDTCPTPTKLSQESSPEKKEEAFDPTKFFDNLPGIDRLSLLVGVPVKIPYALFLQYLLANSQNIFLHTTEELSAAVNSILSQTPTIADSFGCSLSTMLGLGTAKKSGLSSLPELANIKPNHPASSTQLPKKQKDAAQIFSAGIAVSTQIRNTWHHFCQKYGTLLIKISVIALGILLFGTNPGTTSLAFLLFLPQMLSLPSTINTLAQLPLKLHLQYTAHTEAALNALAPLPPEIHHQYTAHTETALETLKNYTKSFEDPMYWFSNDMQTTLKEELFAPDSKKYLRTPVGKICASWAHKCTLAVRSIGIMLGFSPQQTEADLCVQYGEQLTPKQKSIYGAQLDPEAIMADPASKEIQQIQNASTAAHTRAAYAEGSLQHALWILTQVNGTNTDSLALHTLRETGRYATVIAGHALVCLGLGPLLMRWHHVFFTGKRFSLLRVPLVGTRLKKSIEHWLPKTHSLLFTGGLNLRAEEEHKNPDSQVLSLREIYREFKDVTLGEFLRKQARASLEEGALLLKKTHTFSQAHNLPYFAQAIALLGSLSAVLLLGLAKISYAALNKIEINIQVNLVRNTLKAQAKQKSFSKHQPLLPGWDAADNFHGIEAQEFSSPQDMHPDNSPFQFSHYSLKEDSKTGVTPGIQTNAALVLSNFDRARTSFWTIFARGGAHLFIISGVLRALATLPEAFYTRLTSYYTYTTNLEDPDNGLNDTPLGRWAVTMIPGLYITRSIGVAMSAFFLYLLSTKISILFRFAQFIMTLVSFGFSSTASLLGFSNVALLPSLVGNTLSTIVGASLMPWGAIPVVLFVIKYLASVNIQEKIEQKNPAISA